MRWSRDSGFRSQHLHLIRYKTNRLGGEVRDLLQIPSAQTPHKGLVLKTIELRPRPGATKGLADSSAIMPEIVVIIITEYSIEFRSHMDSDMYLRELGIYPQPSLEP